MAEIKRDFNSSRFALDSGHDYRVYTFTVSQNGLQILKGGLVKWHYEKEKFIAARTHIAAVKLQLPKARRKAAKDRNSRAVAAAKQWRKYQSKRKKDDDWLASKIGHRF